MSNPASENETPVPVVVTCSSCTFQAVHRDALPDPMPRCPRCGGNLTPGPIKEP